MENSNTQIVSVTNGQAVTTSLAIAEGTEVEHASVIKLVRDYLSDLEEFGPCRFQIAKGASLPQGGFARATEYALLNEHQATLVITFMRNSEVVRGFKKRLVKAFFAMAEQLSRQTHPVFQIPKTLSEALLLAGKLAAENELLTAQAIENQPKVDIHDEMAVDEKNGVTVREVAKVLGFRERAFRRELEKMEWIFSNRGNGWEPTVRAIDRGVCLLKIEKIAGRLVSSPVITWKGVTTLKHLFAKDDLIKQSTYALATVKTH